MRSGTRQLRLVVVLALAVAVTAFAEERPLRPARSGGELPTTAVDATRFPRREGRASRTSYHVSTKGDDSARGTKEAPFRTIRHALRVASNEAGSGLVVHAGTYREGAEDDDVALRIDREGVVVAAAPGEAATVEPAHGAKNGLAIAASHVTWTGISFAGFASSGISLGVEGRTVEDVVLADLSVRMPAGGDGVAVYPDGRAARKAVVAGLLLERVTITGADLGFTVGSGPARDVCLRDVTVSNRSTHAGNSGSDAIAVEEGDNVLLDGVEATGAEGDGIDLKATRVAVLNAWVHDVDRNGVKLWKGGCVVNTLVHDTGADAAIVFARGGAAGEKPARYRAVNATVAFHNRRSGEAAYVLTCGYDDPGDAIELELTNSVFYRNAGGLALSKGTRATVVGCAFLGAKNGRVADHAWDGSSSRSIDESDGAGALARLGTARGNVAAFAGSPFVEEAPRSLEGFRLAPRSPLVNAGAVVSPFPATDLVGGKRLLGGKPDVGALESR